MVRQEVSGSASEDSGSESCQSQTAEPTDEFCNLDSSIPPTLLPSSLVFANVCKHNSRAVSSVVVYSCIVRYISSSLSRPATISSPIMYLYVPLFIVTTSGHLQRGKLFHQTASKVERAVGRTPSAAAARSAVRVGDVPVLHDVSRSQTLYRPHSIPKQTPCSSNGTADT
ncbi:hypothetical protein J6590_039256 [Homalodisca vitripennis]|nr:hypothetical protein J6590_039256 [Homalodisca vitripennis]